MTLKKTNIRFPLVATVITVLAIVVMVKLGFWQLERAEQKRQLFSDYEQQKSEDEAIPFAKLKQVSPESDRFRYVEVTGQFLQQPVFFLDNQIEKGIVGYEVIALFQPRANSQTNLPVNMGWLPAPKSRKVLPEVSIPQGMKQLTGFLYFPSDNPFTTNTYETDLTAGTIRIQQFQPAAVAKQLDIALTNSVLLLETPEGIGWQRDWKPQVMSPEKHQGYALQWFSLAIACLVIFLFAVIKLNKQPKKEETR